MTDRKQQLYKIGSLAKKTGFSPHLLRAWETRHHILCPHRGPGNQRLYSRDDLLILRYVAEKIQAGTRIGELAALGRTILLNKARSAFFPKNRSGHASRQEKEEKIAFRFVRPIVEAAITVDFMRLAEVLDQAFFELSRDELVYLVILPALEEVGQGYMDGRISVAGEHLVSVMAELKLLGLIDRAGHGRHSVTLPPALCCCLPDEQHITGLLAVSYALSRQGFPIIFLGASLPLKDLKIALAATGPGSVWISVTDSVVYEQHRKQLVTLATASKVPFFVGGQGVRPDDHLLLKAGCILCPSPFHLPADLATLLAKTNISS